MEENQELTPEQLEQIVSGSDTFEEFQSKAQKEEQVEEQTQSKDSIQDEPQEPSNEENQNTDETNSSDEGEEQPKELSDAEFRKLVTAKFKANGIDMEVTDPNDIVKLMQYGANYHKKMAELAPNRKFLKALNENGLLQEDKINDLIALSKGDKKAIAKYLKDNEIDTFELPDLEEDPYQRQDYLPSDSRINLEEKREELMQTESGRKTLSVLGNLSEEEFTKIYSDGSIIHYMDNLNRYAESGLLDEALSIVTTNETLGKYPKEENGKPIGFLDKVAYEIIQIEKRNQQPKIVGNNLNQQQVQPNQAKQQASIPSNQQPQKSYSGVQEMITTAEFDKYATWEDFLKANNLQ